MITNLKYVEEFEKKCAEYLKVKHTVAVSSGTSGLILALKCLDLKGEVIIPSFTFTSTAHSLLWCGIKPVFVDIDPETFNINPEKIEEKITDKTSGIMPVHVFGNPCKIEQIEEIAERRNLKVIYDAAHAFGSLYKGKPISNFGDAVVYSFTPTKVLSTGEGGLIALKDNKSIMHMMKIGRNNGDSFNREEEFLGITARMAEFNAILGIEGLKILDRYLERRLELVELYKKELGKLDGVSFQKITPNSKSVFKDMAIIIRDEFGISRDRLIEELKKRDIETKAYFFPPIHKKKVYSNRNLNLPETEFVSHHIMSLPLYSHMEKEDVLEVCSAIKEIKEAI